MLLLSCCCCFCCYSCDSGETTPSTGENVQHLTVRKRLQLTLSCSKYLKHLNFSFLFVELQLSLQNFCLHLSHLLLLRVHQGPQLTYTVVVLKHHRGYNVHKNPQLTQTVSVLCVTGSTPHDPSNDLGSQQGKMSGM